MLWIKLTQIKGYNFWYYENDGKCIYNVTLNGEVPENFAGYYSLEYILKVKNCYGLYHTNLTLSN